MIVWFDMDGTIADLYGVTDWLDALKAEDTRPYREAKGIKLAQVVKAIRKAQKNGVKFGIVSWLAKGGTKEYGNRVAEEKRRWLKKHMPAVEWDYVDILPYGTPKHENRNGILFDDEEANRKAWGENAYTEKEIVRVLNTL